jgi:hypothetical protein
VKQTKQNCLPGEVVPPQLPNKLHRRLNYWNQGITVDETPEAQNDSGLALVACGLWLHIGLIGAIALAAGLLQWFQDPRLPWSPVVALCGGVLAAASWRRGFAVLEQAEHASTAATDGSRHPRLRNPLPDHPRREPPPVPISASIEP